MPKIHYDLKKQPLQDRARFTVAVLKEAAAHILREQGCEGLTTNKVAEKAGVSIGSLYQYFPSKESLIAEIKRDHFKDLRQSMKAAYESVKDRPLAVIVKAFIDASIEAHRLDPPLHKVLSGDLSEFKIKENDRSKNAVHALVESLLTERKNELRGDINIPLATRLTYKVIEGVIHDAVLYEPDLLEEERFVDEVHQMVMVYLTGTDSSAN